MDFPDNNQLICGAFLVLAAPSLLTLKSIQKGIPTIVIDGAGLTGNFYDYRGLIELEQNKVLSEVENQLKLGRDIDFIKNTIEGGVNFNSTEKYIEKKLPGPLTFKFILVFLRRYVTRSSDVNLVHLKIG